MASSPSSEVRPPDAAEGGEQQLPATDSTEMGIANNEVPTSQPKEEEEEPTSNSHASSESVTPVGEGLQTNGGETRHSKRTRPGKIPQETEDSQTHGRKRPRTSDGASSPSPSSASGGGIFGGSIRADQLESLSITQLRQLLIEKKQELLANAIQQRQLQLKELAFLESGGDLLRYDPRSIVFAAGSELNEEEELSEPEDGEDLRNGFEGPPKHSTSSSEMDSTLAGEQDKQKYAGGSQNSSPAKPVGPGPIYRAPTVVKPLPPPLTNEQIAAKAARDAEVIKRVEELRLSGVVVAKPLAKQPDPPRNKTHWDFLLEEMSWLANDFKEERRWKLASAKKAARAILKHHKSKENQEKRSEKDEELRSRRAALAIAREVKKYWLAIERRVKEKYQALVEEEKKVARDKQLDFLVGQTERYSQVLAKELQEEKSRASLKTQSEESPALKEEPSVEQRVEPMELDSEFLPGPPLVDDETTIEEEEALEQTNDENEVDRLRQEGEMPLEALVAQYAVSEEEAENFAMEEEDQDDNEDEDGDNDSSETSVGLKDIFGSFNDEQGSEEAGRDLMTKAAAAANEAQPTGFTYSTTKVKTKVPFLLKHSLREYQHIGLDWLVSMYERSLNGILADEMGLGKTIMTISLLAYLACEKQIWGPHLIVVPTSVMLNWEREVKKWCPAFKVLVYHGSPKERKLKRQGWSKPNAFHICITSYRLAVQDQQAFRRKQWQYFILDEAHTIKNFRSQRWQVLLNFNSKRRLLLTGTPLQNSIMELWAFMHFLMPQVFQSHSEFKDWFVNPVNNMIENSEGLNEDLISRLHNVLRPFLLRRLKKDVEKQLPRKYEHIISCPLSKRQRYLYEEFMASSDTKSVISGGNFFNIVNVLMQLRKVCNHPDLFEPRPIVSSLDLDPILFSTSSFAVKALLPKDPFASIDLSFFNLILPKAEHLSQLQVAMTEDIRADVPRVVDLASLNPTSLATMAMPSQTSGLYPYRHQREDRILQWLRGSLMHTCYINRLRHSQRPLYGLDLRTLVQVRSPVRDIHSIATSPLRYFDFPNALLRLVVSLEDRADLMRPAIERFAFVIPPARVPSVKIHCSHPEPSRVNQAASEEQLFLEQSFEPSLVLHNARRRMQVYFPDKRLIQFDCGKLQQLAILLRRLKSEGHRALIFTQMSRMLDVLEVFLNIYGYTYFRLDGTTKVEQRQYLMERFNVDQRIFLFILSTRSGGIGVNLTGADTVIFYDSDWNPAMDQQAQDRCHRIGQTREVHIYRLISEHTVEENILLKANQKRLLDDVVIKGGCFTTDFFKNLDVRQLIDGKSHGDAHSVSQQEWERAVSSVEDETDRLAMQQVAIEQREAEAEEFEDESQKELVRSSSQTLATVPVADDPFLSGLTAVERYMFRFLEVSEGAANNETRLVSKELDGDSFKNLKSKDAEATDLDNVEGDALYYEVNDTLQFRVEVQRTLLGGRIYGPPDPEHLEEWHLPRGETRDGFALRLELLLKPPEKRKDKKKPSKHNKDNETLLESLDKSKKKRPYDFELKKSDKEKDKKHKKELPVAPLVKRPKDKNDLLDKNKRIARRKPGQGGSFSDDSRLASWSAEEDFALLEAINEFGLNWDLLADIINTTFPRKFKTRTMCYERWLAIRETDAGAINAAVQREKAVPVTFPIIEVLKRSGHKKKLGIRPPPTAGTSSSSDISAAHVSHANAATSSGTLSSKDSRSPLEVLAAHIQRMTKDAEAAALVPHPHSLPHSHPMGSAPHGVPVMHPGLPAAFPKMRDPKASPNFAIGVKAPFAFSQATKGMGNIILNNGGGQSQNFKKINDALSSTARSPTDSKGLPLQARPVPMGAAPIPPLSSPPPPPGLVLPSATGLPNNPGMIPPSRNPPMHFPTMPQPLGSPAGAGGGPTTPTIASPLPEVPAGAAPPKPKTGLKKGPKPKSNVTSPTAPTPSVTKGRPPTKKASPSKQSKT